jgi:hypothetical protein
VAGQLRHREGAQQPHRGRRVAEADERVELGQRADQLGLVVGVLVVAVRRVAGEPGRLLAGESHFRLLEARVRLQRERFVRGQHLEQVRQRRLPALAALGPEQLLRVGAQRVEQRGAAPVRVDEV